MNLYTDKGYLDMGAVLSAPYPVIIMVGARGLGKTYGTLLHYAGKEPFIYFRRTERILQLITDPALHVFKKICADTGREIRPEFSKGLGRFYEGDMLICYAAALSTFANVRGFDGSDMAAMIYDEFIPEPTERITFNAYTALLNAYETINRNREFDGKPPLKLVLLSNSDKIYSDIISGFGVGDKFLYMQETGTEVLEHNKEVLLICPRAEEFAEKKAATAIYRAVGSGQFADVALKNKFPIEDRTRIGEKPLSEYRPLAAIRGICIYRHKSNGQLYVTNHISGAPKLYEDSEADRRRYLREFPYIWQLHQRRRVYFSGVDVQTKFKSIYE